MTLFVDRREDQKAYGAPALSPYLRRYITPASDVDNTTELDSGDVLHSCMLPNGRIGTVAYEIKHVGDVLACMQDGRLAGEDGQLDRMQRAYDIRWLIIEDRIEPDPDSGVLMKKIGSIKVGGRRKGRRGGRSRVRITDSLVVAEKGRWVPALYGSKQHVLYSTLMKHVAISCFHYGCMLWRTSSREETAIFLASQYEMWQKEYKLHKSIRTFNAAEQSKRPMLMPPDRKLRTKIANAFDNVGYERAREIAQHFSSPDEMVHAMATMQLPKIAGVGKVLTQDLSDWASGRRRK